MDYGYSAVGTGLRFLGITFLFFLLIKRINNMLQYPKQRKPRASGSERKSVSSHILREFPYAAP